MSYKTKHVGKWGTLLGVLGILVLSGCAAMNSTRGGIGGPTSTSPVMITPLPAKNPYPPYTGTLVLSDPLMNNSQGNAWDEVTNGTMICGFANGGYHVMAGASQDFICVPESPKLTLSDVTLQIGLKVLQGDTIGITFRLNQTALTGYLFSIDIQQGIFTLATLNGAQSPIPLVAQTSISIKKGLGQTNVLAVAAIGSKLSLYINGQPVAQVTDTHYSQGQLGIFATSTHGPADVEASDASAWQQ